jgi:hypothetical protein
MVTRELTGCGVLTILKRGDEGGRLIGAHAVVERLSERGRDLHHLTNGGVVVVARERDRHPLEIAAVAPVRVVIAAQCDGQCARARLGARAEAARVTSETVRATRIARAQLGVQVDGGRQADGGVRHSAREGRHERLGVLR